MPTLSVKRRATTVGSAMTFRALSARALESRLFASGGRSAEVAEHRRAGVDWATGTPARKDLYDGMGARRRPHGRAFASAP
jgi:hypothetical protein